MNKSELKIELSLEDVKSLLSNKDGALKVSVKNAIVQAFSKKYLKGVFDRFTRIEVDKTIKEFLFVKSSVWKITEFKEEIKKQIMVVLDNFLNRIVPAKIESLINRITKEKMAGNFDCWLKFYFSNKMKTTIIQNIESTIKELFDSKYEQALTKKVIKKLNS